MLISGKAKIAGVMGWPVEHSLSPRIHNFWLDRAGIDGVYVPLPVAPQALETSIRALGALGFAGVNLTVPHKEAALACVDEVTPGARQIGAVNTLVVRGDGSLIGDNTDGAGFRAAIEQDAPDFSPQGKPVAVCGAGGAARAIVYALSDWGASEIRIINRTSERASRLAEEFGPPCAAIPWEDRHDVLSDIALLVNTTSCGLAGEAPLDLSLETLAVGAVVNDIVYTPLMTPLLADATARGNPIVDGLGMLLHQARPAFRAWFDIDPPVTYELRDYVLEPLT